ncbi:hypothetical protein L1887_05454 [Cichorium endivia]|nr:hypothetical protein L1887_05454 [Cichorium endivia]
MLDTALLNHNTGTGPFFSIIASSVFVLGFFEPSSITWSQFGVVMLGLSCDLCSSMDPERELPSAYLSAEALTFSDHEELRLISLLYSTPWFLKDLVVLLARIPSREPIAPLRLKIDLASLQVGKHRPKECSVCVVDCDEDTTDKRKKGNREEKKRETITTKNPHDHTRRSSSFSEFSPTHF